MFWIHSLCKKCLYAIVVELGHSLSILEVFDFKVSVLIVHLAFKPPLEGNTYSV